MEKKRNINADIIRIVALLSVFIVHIFLNNGYYNAPIDNAQMYIATYFRQFGMICVPLFLLLTGYLYSGKEISYNKKYIFKLGKILIPYGIITVLTYFIFSNLNILSNTNFITMLFGFKNNGYTWYIEMYIGLYLLIPLINAGYNALKTQEQKRNAIYALLFICSIPTIANIADDIMPNYWSTIYPVFYYVVGMYLKEYPLKLKKFYKFIILFISQAISFVFAIILFKSNIWHTSNNYIFVPTVITAIIMFSILQDINTENAKPRTEKCLKIISNAVLPTYMVSAIIDKFVYGVFATIYLPTLNDKLLFAIPLLLMAFTISLLCGLIITKISDKLYNFIFVRREQKSQA